MAKTNTIITIGREYGSAGRQIGTFRKGEYCRVCELLEKTIYGEEELEEYEKRTLNRFMKKLTVPGEKCNLKMRMNLRYACFKFLGM